MGRNNNALITLIMMITYLSCAMGESVTILSDCVNDTIVPVCYTVSEDPYNCEILVNIHYNNSKMKEMNINKDKIEYTSFGRGHRRNK